LCDWKVIFITGVSSRFGNLAAQAMAWAAGEAANVRFGFSGWRFRRAM
jgi:hypothetical protein